MATDPKTLRQVTAACIAALDVAHPGVTVVGYTNARTKPATPGILVEMDGGEMADQLGTRQVSIRCRYSAYCLIDNYTATAEEDVRELATSVVLSVHGSTWSVGPPAKVVGLYPDAFEGFELEDILVWRVDWEQVVDIGASAWAIADAAAPEFTDFEAHDESET